MILIQAFRVRSAYVCALLQLILVLSAASNEIRRMRHRAFGRVGFLGVYVLPLILANIVFVEALTSVGEVGSKMRLMTKIMDIFTPLTGR